jgi:osmotically-inducible protein OsmY
VQTLASSEATLQHSTTVLDRDIRAKLCSELSEQPWSFPPSQTNVIVDHGEVRLWGYIATESARRAIVVTAENIAGVRRVHDHMDYTPMLPPFLT